MHNFVFNCEILWINLITLAKLEVFQGDTHASIKKYINIDKEIGFTVMLISESEV